jgi:hypothetical protein
VDDFLNFRNNETFDFDVHCYVIFGDQEVLTEEFDFVFLSRKGTMMPQQEPQLFIVEDVPYPKALPKNFTNFLSSPISAYV